MQIKPPQYSVEHEQKFEKNDKDRSGSYIHLSYQIRACHAVSAWTDIEPHLHTSAFALHAIVYGKAIIMEAESFVEMKLTCFLWG
jgi:hypothetical protein